MSSMYCWSLFGGRYIAAIMIGLLLLMCILVAVISSCVGVVIGSWMMSDLMASSTPPYPSFLSFRRSEYPGGNISLSVMLWLSHVSVPMRMSGSCVEMKLPSSAVLFLILWKFILMILRGLWACLSAVVVGGEASLLLVGDVLMSSEENELLVPGELGRLLVG